ncbi:MAG: pitrilysin family protein [Polyangia bacterium]
MILRHGKPRSAAGTSLLGLATGALALLFLTCAHRRQPPTPVVPPGAPSTPATRLTEGPDVKFWKGRSDLIRPPAPPPAVELVLPGVDRWSLKNGLQVVAVPRRGLPIISFTVAVKSGGYDEQKGRTQGVADFVAAMLRNGAGKRGAEEIADAIDGVGGSLEAAAGMESSMVTCSVLVKNAALCLNLLADMLLRPTFPPEEMAEIRDQMLASLAARADDPHQLAAAHFDNLLFGEEHPDGWVLTEEQVKAISRESVVAFWKSYYRPNNAMLAVAGDFDVAAVKQSISRAFSSWQSAPIRPRPVFKIPEPHGTRVLLVDKPDLSQATLMFGHRGIAHGDPDWYAATLVNYVLGGSDFSSRLMAEVRSMRGLTYGIGSSLGASLYQGAFRISAATRNETAWDALSVTVDELRKMKSSGPTAAELAKAKGYYAGSLPFELESAAGIARRIVAAELHGLGASYVRELPVRLAAVDQAAARAAALSRLEPDNLAIVMVGRAAVIEPQLRQGRLPGVSSGVPGLPFERVDFRAPISAAERKAAGAPTPPPGPAAPQAPLRPTP